MDLSTQQINEIVKKLQNGETLPDFFQKILFPTQQAEYELSYATKMRKEDILANNDGVPPVPLQLEKIFNGKKHPTSEDGWRNIIAFGDNLQLLKTLYENKDPLIKDKVKGKIKLIYIDPPFATESDFKTSNGLKAYTDKKKGSDFIEFLRRRLILARELLADDGNIIVHLDNKKSHYIKIVLDEIFGEHNYINEIIWHKGREGGSSRSHSPSSSMPTEYQNILIYAKDRKQRHWNPILGPYKESTVKNIEKDENGWFYTRGRMGRHPTEAEKLAGAGLKTYVYQDTTKTKEEVIKLITKADAEYVALGDVWTRDRIKMSTETKYPTEKPESLLKYFIEAGSNEGDLVMDFFGGSGSTAATAEKLGRRWITCDMGKLSFYTIQKRIMTIQNSKDLKNTNKKYGKQANSFMTLATGIYDLEKVFNLDKDKYNQFVMDLFEIEEINKEINGIRIDGERKDGHYAISFPYWEHDNIHIDEEYLEDIHQYIGDKVGRRLYIIAPANYVDFLEDYYEIENTRYYFLKVPYQVIKELHSANFKKIKQPQSKNQVNDLENAIGFHFMKQPEVISEITSINGKNCLVIRRFKSSFDDEETFAEMENFESLSLVLLDQAYNDEEFIMDYFHFADEFISKPDFDLLDEQEIKSALKTNREIIIPLDSDDKPTKLMAIYVDIYGNEFRETFNIGE